MCWDKAFGMIGHLLPQGFHITHPQGIPMRFVAVVLVADIAVLQHIQEFSLGYMQVKCDGLYIRLSHPNRQITAPGSDDRGVFRSFNMSLQNRDGIGKAFMAKTQFRFVDRKKLVSGSEF